MELTIRETPERLLFKLLDGYVSSASSIWFLVRIELFARVINEDYVSVPSSFGMRLTGVTLSAARHLRLELIWKLSESQTDSLFE